MLDPLFNNTDSAWERYKAAPWSVRILVPVATIAIAVGLWADLTSDPKESSPRDVIVLDHITRDT